MAVVVVAGALPALALTAVADERAVSLGERLSSGRPALPPGIDPKAVPLAGGRGMEQLMESARREEERLEERKRHLATPALREKRELSKTEHLGVSDAVAGELVEREFAELLKGPQAGMGLDQLAGRSVKRFIDDHTVVLEGDEKRPPVLLESPLPLRAVADDGRTQLVDLSLQRAEDGFGLVNAATDIKLPAQLSDGLKVGPVSVVPSGSAEGVLAGGGENGDRVLYANAQIDTDVVITPMVTGVEVFWQMRSPRAPEEMTLDLQLPEGALTQATEAGSAVITKDGKRMTTVTAPVAVDAQGQDVPVTMGVRGGQLVLSIAHRHTDVAYPILVDPVIEDYWSPATNGSWMAQNTYALDRLDNWYESWSPNIDFGDYIQRFHCYAPVSCDANTWSGYQPNTRDGLHIYVQNYPFHYPAGSYAQWIYPAPGITTRIAEVGMYGFYHRRYSAQNSSPHPYLFTGIWSTTGVWTSLFNYFDDVNHHTMLHYGDTSHPGHHSVSVGFLAPSTVVNFNWRDAYIGAASIALTDPEPPSVATPSVYRSEPSPTAGQPNIWAPRPSGWMRRSDIMAVRAGMSDPGLGVRQARLTYAGVWNQWIIECAGNHASPCPDDLPADEDSQLVASLENTAEGINTARVYAWDPLGQVGWNNVEIKVDDTPPTISLGGDLWNGKENPAGSGTPVLGSGTHGLSIQASDPGPQPGIATSGVEKIEVKIDGDVVATDQGSCAVSNCSRAFNWNLDTSVYGGKRTIRVFATDGAGNVKNQAVVVNLPSRAELVQPIDGESTSSRLALLAEGREDGFTAVEFQYREMPAGLWKTIGGVGTMLRDDQGNVVSATSHPLDQPGRRTKKLIWDARTAIDVAMLTPKPGSFQVRAVFSGNGGHASKPANVELDAKGLGAGNAQEEVGPGSLDLLSGNFSYMATDAALSGFGQGLTLTRSYNSHDPDRGGVAAPMGPGWVMSSPVEGISDYNSLVELKAPGVEQWVDVFDSAGMRIRFEWLGDGAFKPEPGFEDLTLTKAGQDYTLTDLDGTVTTFSVLAGSIQPVQFVPSKVQQAGQQGVSGFRYELHGGQPRLKRILAPAPPGLDCSIALEHLPRGCKVLELDYASIQLLQFGQPQRLMAIRHVAWDPATSTMKNETVAQFSYYEYPTNAPSPGTFGRLKEAWDPRVSPALKERYFYDSVGRLHEIAPPGEASWWLWYYEPSTADAGKFAYTTRDAAGSGREGWSAHYRMPLTGPGAWFEMGPQVADAIGQTDRPTDGTVITRNRPEQHEYLYTGHYLNQDGRVVNVVRPGLGTATTEYDRYGNVVRELTAQNRADALAAGGASATAAGLLSTYRTYSSDGLRLVDELGPQREVKLDSGQVVEARAHTVTTYDEGSTLPVGKPAHLPTTVTTGAQLEPSDPDVDVRTTKTEYDWTLRTPTKTTVDPVSGGLNIASRTAYNSAGLETESRQPKSNGSDAGTTRTVYYGDSSDPACTGHAEWFNLPCKTLPASQPSTAGLPDLPVTTYAYNRFGQVTTAIESVGSTNRTTTTTYDAAGRTLSTAVSSSDEVDDSGGLVGAWGFEEESGSTVTDSSPHGNDGTVVNAARTDEGRFGRAIRFDGVGDSIGVADDDSLDMPGAMTIEAWVRPDPVEAFAFGQVIGKAGSTSSCNPAYALHTVNGYMDTPVPWPSRCSAALLATTAPTRYRAWSHLAMTANSANRLTFYLDGVEVGTANTGSSPPMSATDLLIGSNFTGLIDEVRVYKRELSTQEVRVDMRSAVDPQAAASVPSGTPPANLIGAFAFEEDPNSLLLADSSGNGVDGEIADAARSLGGRHGSALTTSGGMASVPDANGVLSLSGEMTIDAWVGLEHAYDPISDPSGVIAGKADAYVLQISTDGEAQFAIDPSGTATFLPEYTVTAGSAALDSGRLVHVTGTYDGAALRIYLDGDLVGEREVDSGPSGGSEAFTIGGSSGEAPLAATIDEVRVYDRALGESEIQQDATVPVVPLTSEGGVTTPVGPYPVATTSYGYNPVTGRPLWVSTPQGQVRTEHDDAGRLVSYTDADGTVSTTSYDNLNRPTTSSDGKGTQALGYDPQTALLTSLSDSHAGTFTASYDADGRIVSKGYPNGMQADTTYDEIGAPVRLTYTKTSNCSSGCTWIDEQVTESVHGQWRTHSWDLSSQEYSYDKAGRLTRVEDDVHAPAAVEGCTIRSYSFDQNSNRTVLNTRAPATGGACQPSVAGTEKTYAYDDADRLLGAGIQYDDFGRMTSVPSEHSGGGALTYRYYANDQVRLISQDGVSKTYMLDPAGRQRQTVRTGGTTHTETLHYRDDSDSPSWTRITNGQGQEVSWERSIEGIGGDLAAIRIHDSQGDRTTLQLSNLHGDTVATASLDPSAAALLERFESDEYGNPRQPAGVDKRYGWLGSKQRRTELASGVIQMGARSYIPMLGRFTSVDPLPGGSANSYEYAAGDPVNNVDLDGRACGPGGAGDIVVPDYVFKPACKRHDQCYGTYPGPSKATCDTRFRRHMHRICDKQDALVGCGIAAESYYAAVKHGGAAAFKKARTKAKKEYEKACACNCPTSSCAPRVASNRNRSKRARRRR